MTTVRPIYTVCPHCKRPVVALPGQRGALCAEHGTVVPMRSAIVNAPAVPQPLRLAPAA
jgi:hypothetical protein